jgi:hypothetical protein
MRLASCQRHTQLVGMFDYYEPDPPLTCLWCGEPVIECQGKDGPNALFVWRQGHRHPVRQAVDEDARIEASRYSDFVLPDRFSVSAFCTAHHVMHVDCGCTEGVWTEVSLDEEAAKVAEKEVRDRRRRYESGPE